MYDKNIKLIIYSWGIMRHVEPKCEISFDLFDSPRMFPNGITEILMTIEIGFK